MHFLRALLINCVALLALHAPDLSAAELPVADVPRVLGLTLEKAYERYKASFLDKLQLTLIVEPPLREATGVIAFGRPVRLYTRREAQEMQLADFVAIRSVEVSDAGVLTVVYVNPGPAYFGTLTFTRQSSGWALTGDKEYHSSSGARYFYGEMYDNIECRDDTEMAERWNSYLDFFKTPRPEKTSGKCPGPNFPEVRAYRSMKQLNKPKASEPAP